VLVWQVALVGLVGDRSGLVERDHPDALQAFE
jgi:hypothetical protein